MSLLKHEIQNHLTEPDGDLAWQIRATHPGQAHLASKEFRGMTCRQCQHWQHAPHQYHSINSKKYRGLIKAARCALFKQLNAGKPGAAVADDAPACRHFEFNPNPPARYSK